MENNHENRIEPFQESASLIFGRGSNKIAENNDSHKNNNKGAVRQFHDGSGIELSPQTQEGIHQDSKKHDKKEGHGNEIILHPFFPLIE